MAAGLGFKTFNTGDVLSAADTNGYLMQGVLVFANATARDAAITSPQEGQFAFTKDNDSLWYYSGSAWVSSGATGDIEGVTAGTGISGGGTSGTVTVTNSMATAIDAKGDLIVGTGADTFARLGVGTNGHTIVADSAEATGLKWAAPSSGALTLIKSQTIGSAVSSITVSDVFSSTYDNYCIILSGGVASVNNWITLQLGSTTSGYYAVTHYSSANQSSALGTGSENGSNFTYAGAGSADSLNSFIILEAPNLAKKTSFFSRAMRTSTTANYSTAIMGSGFENSTTQHTAFTLSGSDVGSGAGTFTGGTIKVYGYQN